MSRLRTISWFAMASVFFGGTYVAAKAGQVYFPPLLLVAFRYDVAAVLLLGYVFATRSGADLYPTTRGDVMGILAAGVLAIGLANGFLFVGQGYTTSAVGSIVFSLAPVLTPIFAALLLADERLSAHGAVGSLVGLVGVGLVAGIDPTAVVSSSGIGMAILLCGAISAALGAVLIRRADATISSVVQTAWALPVSAVLLHGLSILSGESVSSVTWTPAAVVTLGYLSVFAGAVAYIAYFGLLEDVGAITSSLVFYISPVFATLGGWALLGEAISPLTLAGFAVIVVGFAIIEAETISTALPSPTRWLPTEHDDEPHTNANTSTNTPQQSRYGVKQD